MSGWLRTGMDRKEAFEETADVVVVGTGAGGGMMIRELARRGLRVLGLEAGGHHTPADFNQLEDEMLSLLFWEQGARSTTDRTVRILQGRGVGGSTVHNTNLCKRTPDDILRHWHEDLGIEGVQPRNLVSSFEATERLLDVSPIPTRAVNPHNWILHDGLKALGYEGAKLSHNRVGCTQSGYCTLGCAYNAKQNVPKVLVPDAVANGARIQADARVLKLRVEGGRVRGVEGILTDGPATGRSFRVTSDVVCLAASATGSPAILQRSGIADPHGLAGTNLHLHPSAVVAGVFPDPVRGWVGIPQSWECTEFLDFRHGSDDRIWIIPVFAHPIGTASLLPGFGPEHMKMMRLYPRLAALGVLIHDHSSGTVQADENGRIQIDYRLNDGDRAQLVRGMREAARILLAAGADRALVPYESGSVEVREDAHLGRIDKKGVRPGDLPLAAVHPMGTLWMGGDPRRSVVKPTGEHHHVENLFVCDGSLFPTSIGVPPQISIYGFAHHLAPHVAEKAG